MIVSVFRDKERKDKVAEFYDAEYPCSFLKGLLVDSNERELNTEITFAVRHTKEYINSVTYNTDFLNNMERGDL